MPMRIRLDVRYDAGDIIDVPALVPGYSANLSYSSPLFAAIPMPPIVEIEKPPVRRNVVFLIVVSALLMMSLDSTIVATALNAIQQGLHTSINLAGWTLTAYSFGFVLMLPVSGKLADRFGRRQDFLASVVVFTLASLGCAMAGNIYMLILLRAVQAGGGAGFTPTVTGIIVEHFGDARDRYVSLFGSIFPIGAMIGPIFGGYFVDYWSWRDIFYVNLPIGLIIVLLAWRFVPYDPKRPRAKANSMDIAGVVLNHIKAAETRNHFIRSHHSWMLRTFWWTLLWSLVCWPLCLVLVGFAGYAALGIWWIYRVVRGLVNYSERRPMPA